MPHTKAAMTSMKFKERIWTNEYIAAASITASGHLNRPRNVRRTVPLQNISSAGPMTRSSAAPMSQGLPLPFRPYIAFTSGFANANIMDDNLSPIQNIPHRMAAEAIPMAISFGEKCHCALKSGTRQRLMPMRMTAAVVMHAQKLR